MHVLSAEEMIEQFESGALKPESFRHEDHVRMAFEYLCRYPVLEVMDRFPAALKQFAVAQGKAGLYHETITWAFLLLIRERMARFRKEITWEEFAAKNGDLLNWKESVLKRYYTKEKLDSPLARCTFLLPDKILPDV